MKNFKLATIMTLCLTTLMLVTESNKALAKNYYRTCKGYYVVKVISVDGIKTFNIPTKQVPQPPFLGRGKCSPYINIHSCRRRARDFCHRCMIAHWNKPTEKPTECSYNSGGERISKYYITNLKTRLRQSACSAHPRLRGKRNVQFNVYRVTRGNKGCGSRLRTMMRRKLGSYIVNQCPG